MKGCFRILVIMAVVLVCSKGIIFAEPDLGPATVVVTITDAATGLPLQGNVTVLIQDPQTTERCAECHRFTNFKLASFDGKYRHIDHSFPPTDASGTYTFTVPAKSRLHIFASAPGNGGEPPRGESLGPLNIRKPEIYRFDFAL